MAIGSNVAAAAETAPTGPSPAAVAAAITRSVPQITTQETPSTVAQDSDSAMLATTSGTSVDVAKNPSAATTTGAPGAPAVGITVGGGDRAKAATQISRSTVVYQGTDVDASTAVQAIVGGGLRFMTIISGPKAANEYRFALRLPLGARILPVSTGGLAVMTATGQAIEFIAPPWAKDANGRSLPAQYRIEGSTVVLRVNHQGAAYPVVADPTGWYIPSGSTLIRLAFAASAGGLAGYAVTAGIVALGVVGAPAAVAGIIVGASVAAVLGAVSVSQPAPGGTGGGAASGGGSSAGAGHGGYYDPDEDEEEEE
jgi:hypothetical protein